MILRAIDSTGDWTFGNGIQNYLTGQAAIQQLIKTTVLSWLGDCFWAISDGIDWSNLLGNKNNRLNVELAIAGAILNITGSVNGATVNLITGIQLLQITISASRALSIQYAVSTIYSTQQIIGNFQAVIPTPGVTQA